MYKTREKAHKKQSMENYLGNELFNSEYKGCATTNLPPKSKSMKSTSSITVLGRVSCTPKNIGGIAFFTDRYKGGDRINIRAHGDWLGFFGQTSKMLNDKGKLLKVGEVYELLTNHFTDISQFNSIRVISCNSANGGHSSFGQRLSNMTGLPVKAFKGSVSDNGGDPKYGHFHSIIKTNCNYKPVYFSPQ